MEDEILRSGVVKDISTLVKGRDFPEGTLVLLEKLPQEVVPTSDRQNLLRFLYFNTELDFTGATSGRIFHRDFELRWEKNDNGTEVVYLGKGIEPAMPILNGDHDNLLRQCRERWKRYYLFGERLLPGQVERIGQPAKNGDFAVLRIPRLLRYEPAPPGAQRVQIIVREYVHQQTDQSLIFRFEELVPGE